MQQNNVAVTSHNENDIFSAVVSTPFGFVGIRTEAEAKDMKDMKDRRDLISEIVYLPPRYKEKSAVNPTAALAAQQIEQYFEQAYFQFNLPLKEVGTPFQQRVWKAISAIPCGEVLTYGQVAKIIGSAPRAVGQACGANWFPLVIPCHRVTAAGGLGGFAHHDDEAGFHVGVKRYLLGHENVVDYAPQK